MEMSTDLNQIDPASQVVEDPEQVEEPFTPELEDDEETKQEPEEALDTSSVEQLQKSNQIQYNYIQKLQKDWDYWQQKWLKLQVDNQLADFDLKKARKAKMAFSKENKSLKETTDQLLISTKEEQTKEIEGRDILAIYRPQAREWEASCSHQGGRGQGLCSERGARHHQWLHFYTRLSKYGKCSSDLTDAFQPEAICLHA